MEIPDIRHILVPVDFSEGTRCAIDYALALGGKFAARLTLLHVDKPLYIPATDVGFDYAAAERQGDGEAENQLRELAASITADIDVDTQMRYGIPWDCIVQWAAEHRADLIIMPTHGRSGLKHLLLGSVAERVVRHAHCPVLVVRESQKLLAGTP